MSKFKKGASVSIYEDPTTETKPEGTATVIKTHFDNGEASYCSVKFDSDGFICDRFINNNQSK